MFSLEKQRLVVVQLLSHVQLFVSPWTAECQAPQSFTISRKWSEVKITQSCPILCDPMDCSLLGSSVHGILQARILEWVIIPFSMGSSRPRDWTCVFCIAGSFLTIWASREAQDSTVTHQHGLTDLCVSSSLSSPEVTPGQCIEHYNFTKKPRFCSNSCSLSCWCHPTVSSSAVPFSSCLQSCPALVSFPMSLLFVSHGQSIGASASSSVLPMSSQGWFPLGLTGLISSRTPWTVWTRQKGWLAWKLSSNTLKASKKIGNKHILMCSEKAGSMDKSC